MSKFGGARMGLLITLIFFGVLCLQVVPETTGAAAPATASDFEDDTVLVGYQPGTGEQEKHQTESRIGALREKVVGAGTHVLKVPKGQVAAKIERLKADPLVRYAEPNYIARIQQTAPATTNDWYYGDLWGLNNTGQAVNGATGKAGADIKAEKAWKITTGSKSVVVGVVDTGIFYNHPDLRNNLWTNDGMIGGCLAGTHGYNAITGTCDPYDDNSHGTHVAGTIGAQGNNEWYVTGVNWNSSLMALRAFNSGGTSTTAMAVAAIDFAVKAKLAGVNLRVLNNSWSQGSPSTPLHDIILSAQSADILFVTITGNNNTFFGGQNIDTYPVYPGAYANNTIYPEINNVITVAATDQNDNLPGWSNYGAKSANLGAPGVNILSTYNDNSAFLSGTSMAAPHVSGAAALILSAPNVSFNTAQLRTAILGNVDPLPSLAGKTSTGGRLNVCRALPGCSPDFTMSATPASQSVTKGNSAAYTVNLNWLNGLQEAVTLSASGLPAGATATFSPNSVLPDPTTSAGMSTLTVATGSTTPAGTYTLTVTGNTSSLTRSTTVTLVVTSPPDFTLNASPASLSLTRPKAGSYKSVSSNITVTPVGGFTAPVGLSVTGLPTGATASFNPVTTAGGTVASISTLTIKTSSSTPRNTYTLNVTGVGNGITHTINITLTVS